MAARAALALGMALHWSAIVLGLLLRPAINGALFFVCWAFSVPPLPPATQADVERGRV